VGSKAAARCAALVVAALTLLSACSGSGNGSNSPGTASSGASSSSTPPPSGSSTASGSATGSPSPTPSQTLTARRGPLTQAQARAALLTTAEIGSGLRSTAVATTPQPFPCTPRAAPPDVTVPPWAIAKAAFRNATRDIAVTEQLASYADEATAVKALRLAEKGLDCSTGTVNSQTVQLEGPLDVTASFTTKVDAAGVWAVNGKGAKQSIILVKMGQRVLALSFGAATGADESSLDATGIVDRALAKVGVAG
jgi:hypothetical protein